MVVSVIREKNWFGNIALLYRVCQGSLPIITVVNCK
jgi:hypothetical protein